MQEKDEGEKLFNEQEKDPEIKELLRPLRDGTIPVPEQDIDLIAAIVRSSLRKKD